MQSLAKAQEPSGWMMWPVMVQSRPWTDVPSVDGAPTTVDIVKMQEWCAKVGRFTGVHLFCSVGMLIGLGPRGCMDFIVCLVYKMPNNQDCTARFLCL